MELLEDRRMLAVDVQLLKDLKTTGERPDFDPKNIVAISSTVVMFTAETPELGRELWKWDLTVGVPQLVKDIRPGVGSGLSLQAMVNVGGVLYFTADDGLSGRELWKSDGTVAGTVLVEDIRPGTESSNPVALHNANGTLYFSANDGTTGQELWRSNGTAANTFLLKNIRGGSLSSDPASITNIGNTIYFSADDGVIGREVWRSDGTDAGTNPLMNINPGSASGVNFFPFAVMGTTLYFAASDGASGRELWKSNGTGPGTSRAWDINPGAGSSYPLQLTNVNGVLFFEADDGFNGTELWRYIETPFSAATVANSIPGSDGLNPQSLTSLGDSIYYTGRGNGVLYRTTTGGLTTELRNNLSDNSVAASNLLNVNGTLYFDGYDPANGRELWKSNGTVTERVRNIAAGSSSSDPNNFANLNGNLLFSASEPLLGRQLWRSIGSEASTIKESEFEFGASGSPRKITQVGDKLFFLADGSLNTGELWVTDGSANRTTFLGNTEAYSLTNVNGLLYFAGIGPEGKELWKSDGTVAGTSIVADLNPAAGSSSPNNLVNGNGTLFFNATDANGFQRIWRSNGVGAFPFFDVGKTIIGESLIQLGSEFYFITRTVGAFPFYELWRSDGTSLGTANLFSSSTPITPKLANLNETIFFGNSGALWKTNGTLAGTQMVLNVGSPLHLTNLNGQLYFTGHDGANGRELWKSDGTPAGTVPVKDVLLGAGSSEPDFLTNVNGSLYFAATNIANGRELWKSDGTPDGTNLLVDLKSPGSSNPTSLQNINGTLYFIADNNTHQNILWKSDGTSGGTLPVADAAGNRTPQLSSSAGFGFLGPNVFFSAVTDELGYEFYGLYNEVDYGDAPTLTTGANNGARHAATGPRLGLLRDTTETNGVPNANANSDDLNGSDDEDGVSVSRLVRGSSATLTVSPRNVSGAAKLDAWFDWNRDGDWNDANEKVLNSESLTAGDWNLAISVPISVPVGNVAARFRISEEGNLAPTGFAFTGEVEDYVFNVMQDVALNLPNAAPNNVTIRRNGANVEVINTLTSAVLATSPLNQTNFISVVGSTTQVDNIVVDFSGGVFNLPGGIFVSGGLSNGDSLVVTGSGAAQAVYSTAIVPAGQPLLTVTENSLTNVIRYDSFETTTFQGLLTFSAASTLSIGSNAMTIHAQTPIDLGSLTLINGGKFSSSGILSLGNSESIIGYGSISAAFAGDVGSLIRASGGDLSIGDATSPVGFFTRGELDVSNLVVDLLDSNQAVLGSITKLGREGTPGTINAANGLLVDFGNNVTGFGTLNTPNNVNQLLMNNGSIAGNSAAERITLPGYIKGVGTLKHVSVTGTNSPGFSPAAVQYGNVAYASSGTVVMEIGGTTPGSSGHDQINHTGTASLGGTLDIQTINGFNPIVGQSFVLITATAGFTGTFSNVKLPAAPAGSKWDLIYGANQLIAQLADVIDITSVVVNGAATNLNRSGIGTLQFNFDQPVTIAAATGLNLRNHTTGNSVSIAGATLSGNGTNSVTWNLASVVLPDGRYTAELPASQVLNAAGRPMAFSHAIEFHKRRGDMNGDAAVNFADYGVIGANFNPLPGAAYRPGDADGNGAVNFADYGVIGASFGPIPLAGVQLDFGDAAEAGTSFATTLARNGARHVVGSTLTLGASIDAESNGQPSANADGDGADEDGVAWGTLVRGQNNSIGVTVASGVGSAFVSAWLDLNADGDWDDAGEQVLQDVSVVNGLNTLSINIPSTSIVGNVTARVRLSQTAGYRHSGLSASGEVEDYRVAITASMGGMMMSGAVDGDVLDGGVFIEEEEINLATDLFFAGLGEEALEGRSKRVRRRI